MAMREITIGYDVVKNGWAKIQLKDVESELTIIGAIGIEDTLSEGVQSCIGDLQKANMKLWVLSGDKEQTVTAVSRSAGIITDQDEEQTH